MFVSLGFPSGSGGKVAQMVGLAAMQETQVRFLGWEDPLEKEWQPTPVFLPGRSHGQRSLVGYSPWALKESDMPGQRTLSIFTFCKPPAIGCVAQKKIFWK